MWTLGLTGPAIKLYSLPLGGEGVSTDSQGGPSPRPCPGVPGSADPRPLPAPSVLPVSVPVPSVPTRMQPLLAAVSPAPNSCSEPPVGACPSASLSAPLRPPIPSRTWDSAADPHIPQFCRHGTVWGRVTSRGVRSVPEACRVRPAHNTGRPPTARRGPCSDFSFQGVSIGHRGSETA